MSTPMHPDFSFPHARLLIFAKAPVPGQVKTRLTPPLSAAAAARLQAELIHHTLTVACRSALSPVQLWCSPRCHDPFFTDCQHRFGVSLHQQHGADLGERMAHAVACALQEAACVLLVGCDCPAFTAVYFEEALNALAGGYDAVLGPAEDGGYVLVGLKDPTPELFTGIAWGSEQVLDSTRMRLRCLKLRWHELSEQWDVDRPQDLIRLRQNRPLAAALGLSALSREVDGVMHK